MSEFKKGDVVQLKNGGPSMVIDNIMSAGNLTCKWFSGKKLETGHFSPESVRIFKEESDE